MATLRDGSDSGSDSDTLSTSTEADEAVAVEADLPDLEFPKSARPVVPDEDGAKGPRGWDQNLDDESVMRMSRLAHREAWLT